jgi:hypothetical protein
VPLSSAACCPDEKRVLFNLCPPVTADFGMRHDLPVHPKIGRCSVALHVMSTASVRRFVCLAGRDTSINTELSQAAMSFDRSPKLIPRTPDVHSGTRLSGGIGSRYLFCSTGDGQLHATPTLYCAQRVTYSPDPVREHDIEQVAAGDCVACRALSRHA